MENRVLLIEDEGSISEYLADKLEKKYECEVSIAYSYASAVGLWDKYAETFSCIILDLNIDPTGLKDDEFYKNKNVNIDDYFPVYGILFLNKIYEGKLLLVR
jgi:DNA-binding NtrC family response regulator